MMTLRWPPFQVVPFGNAFMLRCSECGEVEQVVNRREGQHSGRQHQRWEHPTAEEREADALRAFETFHMDGYCERCGHDDHDSRGCPIVTPDLLRSWSES